MKKLKGLVAATFTPFDPKGNLKLDLAQDYIDYLVESGMIAIYTCGTTGEGVSMSVDERKTVTETYLKATRGRIRVVAQVGANSLNDSCALAAHAESIGADYVSANAPSYFKIDCTAVLADFMTEIAAAAPKTPFYYYHIPRFTGVAIDMTDFLQRMEKQCPQFVGIKYTDSAAFAYQEAVEYGSGKYDILWGCDEMYLSGLAVGAQGGVGSTYAMIPRVYHDIIKSWEAGDLKSARKFQMESWMFVKTLLAHGHIIPTQKVAMKMLGFDFGSGRLPITPMDPAAEKRLTESLKKFVGAR